MRLDQRGDLVEVTQPSRCFFTPSAGVKASGADCLCTRDESAGGAERSIEVERKCFFENISRLCEHAKGSITTT